MKEDSAAATELDAIPRLILIVGTDASGKDHVAEILENMICERGGVVQKRRRYLSGRVARNGSGGGKTRFELLLERLFLLLHPWAGWMIPACATSLLHCDINRVSSGRHKRIVVGHNCLRGLAFYWAHTCESIEHVPLSSRLLRVLRRLQRLEGLHVVVLSVDTVVRNTRIETRSRNGMADHLDYYMLRNSNRSERIETMLVWLCRTYLGAHLIKNNDLSEPELRRQLWQGFRVSSSVTSGEE